MFPHADGGLTDTVLVRPEGAQFLADLADRLSAREYVAVRVTAFQTEHELKTALATEKRPPVPVIFRHARRQARITKAASIDRD